MIPFFKLSSCFNIHLSQSFYSDKRQNLKLCGTCPPHADCLKPQKSINKYICYESFPIYACAFYSIHLS